MACNAVFILICFGLPASAVRIVNFTGALGLSSGKLGTTEPNTVPHERSLLLAINNVLREEHTIHIDDMEFWQSEPKAALLNTLFKEIVQFSEQFPDGSNMLKAKVQEFQDLFAEQRFNYTMEDKDLKLLLSKNLGCKTDSGRYFDHTMEVLWGPKHSPVQYIPLQVELCSQSPSPMMYHLLENDAEGRHWASFWPVFPLRLGWVAGNPYSLIVDVPVLHRKVTFTATTQ